MAAITFSINGKLHSISKDSFPVTTSLLTFIRNHAQLPGTKFSCLEGGCGACLVTVKAIHHITKLLEIYSVNSCLKSLYTCDGLEFITIEGIGSKASGFNILQDRLNQSHGSQCGFCTPGMIVNMYSLLKGSDQLLGAAEIERSFSGNLCRCTGYRPILDAFKSFSLEKSLMDESTHGTELDIEEFPSVTCPKNGEKCVKTCHARRPEERLEILFLDGRQWFRVFDIQSILDIFVQIRASPYMLVAGNTAQGVYRLNPNLQVFIDINSVDELHRTTQSVTALKIGGNVSIVESIRILHKAAKERGFEYCNQVANHLEHVANTGIRNAGTLAGNFSLKHAHNEFPSDIFTIFAGCGAMLTIVGVNDYRAVITPAEYLCTDMSHKVIGNFMLPKFNPSMVFKSYKVALRAQNAPAYVNAAISLRIQNGIVSDARICFGGINPKFVHAKATESLILTRDLFNPSVLVSTMNCLANELQADWVLPDASPEYRKNLALALFYRYVLSMCPNVPPAYLSGSRPMERPISSGSQSYETDKTKYPLTKPVIKYEGLLQCSGEAGFANDIPPIKDELWAAFVVATKAQKKIAEIDTTSAMAIPGVRFFYSAKDIPGKNNFAPLWIPFNTEVEEIFVGVNSVVKYHSQPIGIIVADTMELAIEAATKVNISYRSDRTPSLLASARSLLNPFIGEVVADHPVIPTIHEAFELNAQDRFHPSEACLKATKVGLNTTKTLKGRFDIEGQYHHHIETQACICIPSENGMNVHSSTQWFDLAQIAIADCLGISESTINMKVRRIGGAFGAKLSRAVQISASCALACHLSKRPVRFVMTMESNMKTIGKRYGLYSDYELLVDDNGHIQEMRNNFAQDYGCSMNESMVDATLFFFPHVYDSSRWAVTTKMVVTDAPSNTFCRAPGALEGIGMIENMMEHIGHSVKRDPMDVRLLHYTNGHPMVEIATNFLADIDYKQRQADCAEFNEKNRWRKRGLAAVPVQWPVIYYGVMPAYVAIYHHDGSVVISHGGIECGQGINTKAAQVAAYTLGIPLEMVSIRPTTSDFSANAHWTAGSSGSEMVCFAVRKSCEILLERMKPIRDTMPPNYKWTDLTLACHKGYVDLRAMYQNKLEDLSVYPVYGTAATEMEVDILTGQYQIVRVDIVEDVGQSLNPGVDVGQIEGAFVMGLGYWLSEKLTYDRGTGELLTNRTWNYKIPGALDIPIDFRINFLRNSPNPYEGVMGAKAVGEPATCMAISAMFALRNALRSARIDAGLPDEFIEMGSACTPEKVFMKTGNSVEQFKL